MRRNVNCVESLENRRMLNAAVEVWAGNSDLRNFGDAESLFMSVDQEGDYTKIGETNLANSDVTFSSGGNYKFFVIATRGRVELDAIQNSNGGYISELGSWANADAVGYATGAPDSAYAAIGTRANDGGTFAGYVMVEAPTTWQGLTITTGTVEPMFRFSADFDRSYVAGTTTPYAVQSDLTLTHNGMIQKAGVYTPAGRWFDLGEGWEENERSNEQVYADEAALNQNFGAGTYTLWMQTSVGQRSYSFDSPAVSFPTQIPSTTSIIHGGTNTPAAFNVALPAITDPNITDVNFDIMDKTEDDVYEAYVSAGESLPTVYLAAGESYIAELDFGANTGHQNELGQEFNYSTSNEVGYVFGTTGFTQSTPDYGGIALDSPVQTVSPGGFVTADISVHNTGGMAYAPGQAVHYLIGLSKNTIIGDADDVVLFAPVDVGNPKDWVTTGPMTMQVPDTASPGQYYVFGMIDSTNVVAETNESNNAGWSSSAVVTILPQAITYDPSVRRISIAGTAGADNISVTVDDLMINATLNGTTRSFLRSSVDSVYINAIGGDDLITAGDGITGATLHGGDGNDTIVGGNGDDWIYGDNGNDSLAGNDGYDNIYGNFGDDMMAGGFRRDNLYAGLGNDTVTAGDGPDSVFGGDGTDVLRGGKGADYIEGRGKSDTIYGGLGNDSLYGGAGPDAIYGEDGDDTIDVAPASVFRDTVDGGLGNDLGLYDSDDLVLNMEGLLA